MDAFVHAPRRWRSGFTTILAVACAGLALAVAPPVRAQGILEYPIPTAASYPVGLTNGPDGAIWFAEFTTNKIGRITLSGTVTEFTVPTAGASPLGITTGPDGALWFSEEITNKIGRLTTAGAFTEFPIPTAGSAPAGITSGPDGNLWFAEKNGGRIGRITTGGVITEFPTSGTGPTGITVGPDGNLWFTERDAVNSIGRITPAGVVTEFPVPTAGAQPMEIAVGPDGALWFAEYAAKKIGRVTRAGVFLEFPLPASANSPFGIVAGPDGALWFTETGPGTTAGTIGRITTGGLVTEYPLPGPAGGPWDIVAAGDGGLWFTEYYGGRIGRIAPVLGSFAQPAALRLDPSGSGVIEPGEDALVLPSWSNPSGSTYFLGGVATSFTGPAGATYSIVSGTGDYGPVDAGTTAECGATGGSCYHLNISVPAARPAAHWDTVFRETVSTFDAKDWTIHVGGSFADVPAAAGQYHFIETIFHNGVTGGCGGGNFCPASPATRGQMAVFLLLSKDGAAYVPPAATGTLFGDVPASSPLAKWIEELAHRGVTAGCGGGNYCPATAVTRAQMAVFLLLTREGTGYTPPAAVGLFNDVPASNGFAKWIEELAHRGITAGCGGGNYCPNLSITRGQMAVFLTATFGLTLYGP